MYVEIVRRGGFVGLTLRGAIDTADLPEQAAAEAEAALSGLPFARPPAEPRHPDSFQYEITVSDNGQHRTVVLDEAQLPDQLRPLVHEALARGGLE